MDVELRHLRAFSAVARLGSFTRAATELAITQPALTRTVQQLEAAVRVRLLDRTSRRVELTGAGAVFLEHVERVLGELERAFDVVATQVGIRLGFSWLLPDPWAQHTVERFERATGGTVHLVRSDDPLAEVTQSRIDVALVRGPVSAPRVRIVHLFDEARVAVCAVGSPEAGRASLDWSEIPTLPLVVNTVSGTTGPWSWPPDRAPRRIVETTNFDEWIESVAAGRGVGVVPEVARRRNIHSRVRFVPVTGAPPIPVSLAFLPDVRKALMRRFVEAAIDAPGVDAPGGDTPGSDGGPARTATDAGGAAAAG